ncbi:MAG: hypothetical protein QM758_06555 [Armatimonas sp.]
MSAMVETFSSDELMALYVAATIRRDDFSRSGKPIFEGEQEALLAAVEKLKRLTILADSSGGVECGEVGFTRDDKRGW